MVFPVAKLGYLALKQISKPTANAIKGWSKRSPFLRNKILIPGAQLYHRLETTFRLRLLGMGKTKKVLPLEDEAALELGTDMLGEVFVFSVGTLIIYLEYRRQVRSTEQKEDNQNYRLEDLENRVREMDLTVATQSAQVRELTRLVYALQPATHTDSLPEPPKDKNPDTVIVDKNSGRKLIVAQHPQSL